MAASLIARSITVAHGRLVVLDAVDLTLADGDRIGLVGPNGVGKSTLLGALAGRSSSTRARSSWRRPRPRSACCRRSPSARLTRPCAVSRPPSRRHAAQTALDDATAASPPERRRGRALQHRARALAGARRAPTSTPAAADVGRPRARRALLDRADDDAVGRRGRARLAGLAAALAIRRLPARRADQRPRLDGLDAWRTGCSAAAPVAAGQPRPAFLERVVTDVRRDRLPLAPRSRSRRRVDGYLAERELARRTPASASTSTTPSAPTSARARQREREWAAQGAGARSRRRARQDIRHVQDRPDRAARRTCGTTERAIERLEVVEEPRDRWELRCRSRRRRAAATSSRRRGAVVERGEFRLGPVDLRDRVRRPRR